MPQLFRNWFHGKIFKTIVWSSCNFTKKIVNVIFIFFSNYGTGGYDNMSQQQYKQDSNSYSSNGQSKSSGGSAGAGSGKGEVPLCT